MFTTNWLPVLLFCKCTLKSPHCVIDAFRSLLCFVFKAMGKGTFYHDKSQINENTVIDIAYLWSGSQSAHISIIGLSVSLGRINFTGSIAYKFYRWHCRGILSGSALFGLACSFKYLSGSWLVARHIVFFSHYYVLVGILYSYKDVV